ncbi:MAG TPA: hypothetical protein VG900_11960 [Hyphomicrobiaceae bacterium]|nr:hypothetical protein [Hyphomicrobiaceae bacterium]
MQKAYLVVPFERVGSRVGARQAMIFDAAIQAQLLAQTLAQRVPGVAVLERQLDPDTGDGIDTLVAHYGMVPPRFPEDINWSIALN